MGYMRKLKKDINWRCLLKICSSVQNQDFTVVDDYITGLKTLMYLKSIDGLKGWDGQSPPTIRHQVGKPVTELDTIVDQVL